MGGETPAAPSAAAEDAADSTESIAARVRAAVRSESQELAR